MLIFSANRDRNARDLFRRYVVIAIAHDHGLGGSASFDQPKHGRKRLARCRLNGHFDFSITAIVRRNPIEDVISAPWKYFFDLMLHYTFDIGPTFRWERIKFA